MLLKLQIKSRKFSYLALASMLSIVLGGCALNLTPPQPTYCKIQTYVDADVGALLSARNKQGQITRMAVLPFEVPASFAGSWGSSREFGHELAQSFTQVLLESGDIPIVEYFSREMRPGTREDFFAGNYAVLTAARDAGYDLVLLGVVSRLTAEPRIELMVKVIDVNRLVTMWYARTISHSEAREVRRKYASWRLTKDRPDDFGFEGLIAEAVSCTVSEMFEVSHLPETDTDATNQHRYPPTRSDQVPIQDRSVF